VLNFTEIFKFVTKTYLFEKIQADYMSNADKKGED